MDKQTKTRLLRPLKETAWEIDQLERLTIALKQRRDGLLHELHAEGLIGRDLAYAAGITEGRAYQILRGGPKGVEGSVNGQPARIVDLDEDGIEWVAFVLEEDEDSFDIHEERS